jgi:hypothetical protein
MIILPRIIAATAVAARIVKNQKSRLPRKMNGLARLARTGGALVAMDGLREASDVPLGRNARRFGEIHGKTARTR